MATVRPFAALRPADALAEKVASLPYDVMNRPEAAKMAEGNPYSFLHIVRSEIDLPNLENAYAPEVYAKAHENLVRFENEGTLKQDGKPCFYIYRQIMKGRVQTGLVATTAVDDYLEGRIKIHEYTREAKEIDRINNFDACDANTAPIFLSYHYQAEIEQIQNDWIKFHDPQNAFTTEDGITHYTWQIDDDAIVAQIEAAFAKVDALYIADGHHRTASAAKVCQKRREAQPNYDKNAEFNYFMAVIFSDKDLFIMDYNRVVEDLNGHSEAELLAKLKEVFDVTECLAGEKYRPMQKGHYGMYLGGTWYKLVAPSSLWQGKDPVSSLDVSILQNNVLDPMLGIKDVRTDKRIDFVGGIRGLDELERRVQTDMKVAFALCPTTMDDLLGIADSGMIMPPKSTWFEPKLRSGLFVHKLS